MLRLFEQQPDLIESWHLLRYEQEGDAYMLHVVVYLRDGSRLDLRDYVFADGQRKYAYHWMNVDGTLRCRWDNAPHWPSISTAPHHKHLPGHDWPEPSLITNLEDLFAFVAEQFATEL
jgi:hypothetical protein